MCPASQPPFSAVSNPCFSVAVLGTVLGAWGAWLVLCLTWNPSCYSNTPLHVTAAPGPSSASAHTGTCAWGPRGLAQVCVCGERWPGWLWVSGSPVSGECCRAGMWMEQ